MISIRGSILNDWQYWSDREPVTLLTHTKVSDVSHPLASAKRRALTYRELSAANGVYTGQDLVWLLPAAVLPSGVVPKMADVIRDSTGTPWTVLEAALNTLQTYWRLTTRDRVLAYGLRDTISVWRPTNAASPAGDRTPKYKPLYLNVQARIQPQAQDATDRLGKRFLSERFQIYVERDLGVEINDQVRDGTGKIYQITGYEDPSQVTLLPSIMCEVNP